MTELRGFHFETLSGNSYYYDDWSGICYPCPKGLKETLIELQSTKPESLKQKESLTYWEKFISIRHDAYGAFWGNPLSSTSLKRPEPDKLAKDIPQNGMRQLYLVVTDCCNLRCRYCIFSDHYPNTNSVKEYMSYDIARKAVDYYITHLKKKRARNPAEPAVINFYGGEPLLNFSLIRDVVFYIKGLEIKNVVYSLTTNALLLNDEISDFLVDNDFSIALSIDGPQSEHDRNRVFPNGSGSFEKVYKNIKRFQQRHPDYKHLIFMATFDLASDFDEIRRFFNSKGFNNSPFFFSRVRDIFTDYYDQFSEKEITQYISSASSLKGAALERSSSLDPLIKYGASAPYYLFLMRRIFGKTGNSEIPATGTCLPGEKICVLTDGTFQPCERVPGLTKMGSVQTGLDYEKIADLIYQYNQKITRHCKSCPILRLCTFCYSNFWSGTTFEKPSPVYCESHIQRTKIQLMQFYSQLEKDPGLYDEFMNRNTKQYRRIRTLIS